MFLILHHARVFIDACYSTLGSAAPYARHRLGFLLLARDNLQAALIKQNGLIDTAI